MDNEQQKFRLAVIKLDLEYVVIGTRLAEVWSSERVDLIKQTTATKSMHTDQRRRIMFPVSPLDFMYLFLKLLRKRDVTAKKLTTSFVHYTSSLFACTKFLEMIHVDVHKKIL
jgi:hypothetical protein